MILISLIGNAGLLYDTLKHALPLCIQAPNLKGDTVKLTTPDPAKCIPYLNTYKATLGVVCAKLM